jgi:hypothetical protein
MYPCYLFQRGEMVKVTQSESRYFNKIGTIHFIQKRGIYTVRFDNGVIKSFYPASLAPTPQVKVELAEKVVL